MIAIRFLLTLVLVLAAIPAAHAQSSEERFRTEMIGRIAKVMPDATLTPKPGDPLAVLVTGGPWSEGQINFDRIYHFCQQASAEDCEAEKAQLIAFLGEKHEAVTPASLRLVVRDRQFVEAANDMGAPQNGETADTLIAEPLGGGLFAVLAADSPRALRLMMGKSLEDLHLTRAEAWAVARRQTIALLPPFPDAEKLMGANVLFEENELGASLMIDLPAWAKLAREVGPDLFVAVLADGILFVGVAADGPRLEAVKQAVATDCAAMARCTSPRVYRFRDGRWAIAE